MGQNVSPNSLIIVISTLVVVTFATELVQPTLEGPTPAPIGCHKRTYTFDVKQSDAKGSFCWDSIEVNACWGRCETKEISDWKFPFKRSHHPVCFPAGRKKVLVTLKNCDPEAAPDTKNYEYTEPTSCVCKICSSSDTSCEYPQQRIGKTMITFGSEDLLNADYSSFAGPRV